MKSIDSHDKHYISKAFLASKTYLSLSFLTQAIANNWYHTYTSFFSFAFFSLKNNQGEELLSSLNYLGNFRSCSPLVTKAQSCLKRNQRCPASKALLISLTSIPRIDLCSESCLKTESKKSECVKKSNT